MSSEIQELIHKTTMMAQEQGRRLERERIIRLLEEKANRTGHYAYTRKYGMGEIIHVIQNSVSEK